LLLETSIRGFFNELENNDFLVHNFNRILELLTNGEVMQHIDDFKNEFSNLLNKDIFFDNVTLQNSWHIEVITTINEKSKLMIEQMNQLPIGLTELSNDLKSILTQDFFSSWVNLNNGLLIRNFESLQENCYRIFISLSNNVIFLKSNLINLPNKSFLTNIANGILSKLSMEHQMLIDISHFVKSDPFELLSLPKTSDFDSNF
jgi:hypothetical protein